MRLTPIPAPSPRHPRAIPARSFIGRSLIALVFFLQGGAGLHAAEPAILTEAIIPITVTWKDIAVTLTERTSRKSGNDIIFDAVGDQTVMHDFKLLVTPNDGWTLTAPAQELNPGSTQDEFILPYEAEGPEGDVSGNIIVRVCPPWVADSKVHVAKVVYARTQVQALTAEITYTVEWEKRKCNCGNGDEYRKLAWGLSSKPQAQAIPVGYQIMNSSDDGPALDVNGNQLISKAGWTWSIQEIGSTVVAADKMELGDIFIDFDMFENGLIPPAYVTGARFGFPVFTLPGTSCSLKFADSGDALFLRISDAAGNPLFTDLFPDYRVGTRLNLANP